MDAFTPGRGRHSSLQRGHQNTHGNHQENNPSAYTSNEPATRTGRDKWSAPSNQDTADELVATQETRGKETRRATPLRMQETRKKGGGGD